MEKMTKERMKSLKVVNLTFGDKTFKGADGELVTIPSSGLATVCYSGEPEIHNVGGLNCHFQQAEVMVTVKNVEKPFPKFDGKTIYIVDNGVYKELKYQRPDVFRCGGDSPISFLYCD